MRSRSPIPVPNEYQRAILELTKTKEPANQLIGVQDYIEHYEKEYKEKLRAEAFDNYSIFSEYINMEEPPALHHHIICEKLQQVEQGDILRLAVSVGAGGGKSEYSSRRFAVWAMGRRRIKWLQASYNASFAEGELGKKTKAYVLTPEYTDIFPNCTLKVDARAGARWGMTNGSEYLARGAGSGISGVRASIGAIDDLYANWDASQNAKVREDTLTWFLADFSSRLLPRAPIVIVNTRMSTQDAIGEMLERSKKGNIIPYEFFNIKSLSDGDPENDPLGRKGIDETYWDYYPAEHFINLRNTMTSKMFSAMYQGEPLDGEGGLINSVWFQRYTTNPLKDEGIMKRRITISVDSAQKKGERHDYSVITAWLESATGHHYLLDMVRKKLELPELMKEIDTIAEKYGATSVLIEDRGSGVSVIQLKAVTGTSIPFIPINISNNSKEFRFDQCAPMFESGVVHIPEKGPWIADFEKELLAFPNGKNDDIVDSVSLYLNWARERQRKGGTKKMNGAGTSSSNMEETINSAIEREMAQKRELAKQQQTS